MNRLALATLRRWPRLNETIPPLTVRLRRIFRCSSMEKRSSEWGQIDPSGAACRLKGMADLFLESHRTPGDQATILSPLVARKATLLLALILIASPVAGLRPMR